MMFLFAGHSDKPLKSLVSMAHKGNHICLYRFSFIYVMELTVMGGVPIKEVATKCSHS